MRTSVENVMEKTHSNVKFREIVQSSFFPTTDIVSKNSLWWMFHESIGRNDSVSSALSVAHDMIPNNCLMGHTHIYPKASTLAMTLISVPHFLATLT